MKQCSVRPYNGEQKYIYLAHSFRDKSLVYPLIEQLTRDGYRVWFDEGITCPYDYTVDLARKIDNCGVMLAVFSEHTVDSTQFKREVNYAIMKKKELIAVILEEVQLSPGMELQMAAFPAIFKYRVDNDAFYKSLYDFEVMNLCLGEPDDSIVVSDESRYKETLADWFGVDERKAPAIDDALFLKSDKEGADMPKAVLVKLTSNEEIEVSIPKMIIGRSVCEKSKPIIDYSIATNSMVSRFHAVIQYKNQEFYLIDCGAVNKTFLNCQELDVNQEYLLHDGDIIKLANEKFRFRRIEV